MKVRISTLPPQGRSFDENLPLDPLNQRLSQAAGNDLQFSEEPQVRITLTPAGGGAHLVGKVVGKYIQPCSRCLEPVEVVCRPKLDVMLQPSSSRRVAGPGEEIDDDGIIYFDGESVDLEDIIQESLILATSPYGPDHPECKAKEAFSKEKSGTLLGDLLAAAQKTKN